MARCIPFICAALLLFVSAVPAWAEPDDFDVVLPDDEQKPSLRPSLEYEDIGQREMFNRVWFGSSWLERFWRTTVALNRGGSRLAVFEHQETDGMVLNLFGGRAPIHEAIPMGRSRLDVAAHGNMGTYWPGGDWERKTTTAGADATGYISASQAPSTLDMFVFHAAGETYDQDSQHSSGAEWQQHMDVLKLFGGVRLEVGTEILVGVTHRRMEWSWSGWEDKDHWNNLHGFIVQDVDGDFPYFGDLLLALAGYRDNKKRDERVEVVNWCVGSFGGQGKPTVGFQHAGRIGKQDHVRLTRLDWTLTVGDRLGRDDHFRRIAPWEGGMNDLGGAEQNATDFYRNQEFMMYEQGGEVIRPFRDLPDYTSIFAMRLEVIRTVVPWGPTPEEPLHYWTFDMVLYPIGLAANFYPMEDLFGFVPNWFWLGIGYDSGTERYNARIGVNVLPFEDFQWGIRFELEKAEGSHTTAYLSAFFQTG